MLADFQLISIDFVPVERLVTRFPVGRILCNECDGAGKVVLFHLPGDCEPCGGTGWMGGKIHKDSSENTSGAATGKTRPPGSEKGET